MVETEKLETLKAIFDHKPIKELHAALLRCDNNLENAIEVLLVGEYRTTASGLEISENRGRNIASHNDSKLDRHRHDSLNRRPTFASIPPTPQPSTSSTSIQYENDLELAKKLSQKFNAENEAALMAVTTKPTMVQMDTKRPSAALRTSDPTPQQQQQQRRRYPGKFSYPAARARHQPASTVTETIDFSSTSPDEAKQSRSLESMSVASETDEKDEHDQDLRSALAASMAPSDLGRLGGFGKEMTTYDAKALQILLSDPEFISSLDHDLRTAMELQRKIDAEERSMALATGSAKAEYPGSLAPPINTDSVSCEDSRLENNNRCYNIAESTKARLLGLIRRRIENARERHPSSQQQQQQQDEINDELQEEQQLLMELQQIKKEATEYCLNEMKSHLHHFLEQNPNATYEEWIEDLHPENTQDGQLLEGLGKIIDHRFYVEESDHRRLWNEYHAAAASSSVASGGNDDDRMSQSNQASARCLDGPSKRGNGRTSKKVIDFLDSNSNEEEKEDGNRNECCTRNQSLADSNKDMITFE